MGTLSGNSKTIVQSRKITQVYSPYNIDLHNWNLYTNQIVIITNETVKLVGTLHISGCFAGMPNPLFKAARPGLLRCMDSVKRWH